MKLIVKPITKNYSSYISNNCDGFLVGLENFCSGFETTHTIEEIKILKENFPSKDIFVSINIPIYDEMMDEVQNKLIELDKINIKGVLFYDLAILELKQELCLSLDLVWNQTHMVTNSKTCNYYYKKGVKYAFLANEITLDEMLEIKNNTNLLCMVNLLGFPVAALSKRKLISNYYQFLEKNSKDNIIIKEPISKQEYNLVENKFGTIFYYNKLLNGSRAYLKLLENGFDYGILSEDIPHDKFLKVLNEFSFMKNNYKVISDLNKKAWLSRVSNLIGSRDTGFFYRKTIFKVKRK